MNEDDPPRSELERLYARAFAEFGAVALWNKRRLDNPSPEHALVIAHALRVEGDRNARQLAEAIEQAVSKARGDATRAAG